MLAAHAHRVAVRLRDSDRPPRRPAGVPAPHRREHPDGDVGSGDQPDRLSRCRAAPRSRAGRHLARQALAPVPPLGAARPSPASPPRDPRGGGHAGGRTRCATATAAPRPPHDTPLAETVYASRHDTGVCESRLRGAIEAAGPEREGSMLRKIGVLWVAVTTLGLAACGGTNSPTGKVASSNQRGTLIDNPALRIASVNATDFAAQLSATASGPQLLQLAGTPACGVDFYYFKYWTVGPDNSAQMASGSLMVPTGSGTQCTGPRPIVLYAHGTTTDSAYNIANISDTTNSANSEAATIAAVFAAQG